MKSYSKTKKSSYGSGLSFSVTTGKLSRFKVDCHVHNRLTKGQLRWLFCFIANKSLYGYVFVKKTIQSHFVIKWITLQTLVTQSFEKDNILLSSFINIFEFLFLSLVVSYKIIKVNVKSHAAPVEVGITVIPNPEKDNVTDVTKVTLVFNIVDKIFIKSLFCPYDLSLWIT